MARQTIHFIITGGTIDSVYDGIKDTVVPYKKSVLPDYLKSLKLYADLKFSQVCMKDSREITKADLKKILRTVEKSPCSKIIITHGTYTMPDTARYLAANLQRRDQTIVFTGAFIPLEGILGSDAPFNLGFAIAKVQDLKPGFYVCMHAGVFSPSEVVKTLYEGRFSSIYG